MIDHSTVDRIMSTAQIVEVVGDFVALRKRGVNYTGLCPFHNEKTPSFSVSPGKNIYKCFGCGKAGNPVNFVMEHEQMSYVDALRYLAKKYHIEIVEEAPSNEEVMKRSERESLMVVAEFARNYFVDILKNNKDGQAIGKAYLRERGLRDDIIEKFQIGYCVDERDMFSKDALKAGFKPEFLDKIGVSKLRDDGSLFDRFRGRIIYPIHAIAGKVIGFGARVLKSDNKEIAKYLNSPESEIYHKSNTLYGIYFAKNAVTKIDKCYLVEGYMDVIAMFQAGIENVVASSGTSLTVEQIRLIRRFTKNVTIVYDGDAAGIKAAFRGIPMVLEEGMNVRVLLLPDGHDPDSFAKAYSASALQEYLKQNEHDFITFTADFMLKEAQNDPVKRASVITDIVKTISVIPDQIYRSTYVKECSHLFKVEESLIYEQIAKIRREKTHGKQDASFINQQAQPVIQPEIHQSAVFSTKHSFSNNERDLLRLLVLYADMDLKNVYSSEHQDTVKVVDYYIHEIIEGDMLFLDDTYKMLFDDFFTQREQGIIVNETYYLNHVDQRFQQFAINNLHTHYKLSKIFLVDKSEEAEAIDQKKEAEKLFLEKLVIETMLSYKLQRIKMEWAKNQELLKHAKGEEEIELLKRQMYYKSIEKEIAQELKRL